MRKLAAYIIPAFILVSAVLIQQTYPDETEALRIQVFDFFQQLQPRPYDPALPVRIVDIDDESLEKIGQWPWPRSVLAQLVARLGEHAKSISFDIVFAEKDRTSPKNILPFWPEASLQGALRVQVEALPDHDTLFAEAIAKAPVVLAFGLTPEIHEKQPLLKSGFAEHSSGTDSAKDYVVPVFRGAVTALPELEKAARGNGCFNIGAELDSTIRRAPSLFRLNDRLVPALALEAVRVFQGASTYKIKLAGATGETSFGEKTGIVEIQTGHLHIPTDSRGRIWLYDTGYQPERFIPAWKILTDAFDLNTLDGTILFVGSSATGIKDLRSTPLNPRAPGVEVHAQLTEQMLSDHYLKRPDWAEGAEFSYLVLLSLLLILLLPRAGAIRCAVLGLTAVLCATGASWVAFTHYKFLLDPVLPSLVILAIYLVSSFLNFLRTEHERSQIRGAFGRYLSPALVEKLAKDPKQLKLGGETKTMTFLFTDIRNFTALAESFDATELTHFMNRFLTPMSDIILKNGGTIDKYMGDCIMAFWNAPLGEPDHARKACLTALEMEQFIDRWNVMRHKEASEQQRPFFKVQIGIGINTGQACVGNMGSEHRFDYTVLGDDVNLASRLEGLSKNYGVTTILGPASASAIPEAAVLELDLIRVKGKNKPVNVFALLGNTETGQQSLFKEVRSHFEKMLEAYRFQRWEEAETALEKCRHITLEGIDLGVLYELYASRILSYKINPPPQGWDGVTTFSSK